MVWIHLAPCARKQALTNTILPSPLLLLDEADVVDLRPVVMARVQLARAGAQEGAAKLLGVQGELEDRRRL